MKKLVIIIAYLFSKPIMAQEKQPFTIEGRCHFTTTDFKNNKTFWISSPPSIPLQEFFDWHIDTLQLLIKNDSFFLKGSLNNPMPVNIIAFNDAERSFTMSNTFFISARHMKIQLNEVDKKPVVTILGSSNEDNEYNQYKPLFDSLYTAGGLDTRNYSKVKRYIKDQSSVVALWLLITLYSKHGFEPEMDSLSLLFNSGIPNTKPYNILRKRFITESKMLSGNRFPVNAYTFKDDLIEKTRNTKLLLLNFWASYCKPCIAEFPELQTLYKDFRSKGFDIYGISFDDQQHTMDSVVKKHTIPWSNSIDPRGQQSTKINIESQPTLLLLRSDGTIVLRNFTIPELSAYLQKNL